MAFWGSAFIFNEIPCEDFHLMVYDVGGEEQGEGRFASTVSVIEEAIGTRWKPYFYGVKFEKKLEFQMVFGVNQKRLDAGKYLDRYEIEGIASWLTGHDRYLWLEIEQDDMEYARYRCMISELSIIAYGNIPWALKATVTCDSPYAYMYPQEFVYEIEGNQRIEFYNESGHNGYYMPTVVIEPASGGNFAITNETDGGRVFQFSNIPTSVSRISVDNDHCVITNDKDLSLYPYFNFKFLRLKRGYNILNVTGNGRLIIQCEFPVNAGG